MPTLTEIVQQGRVLAMHRPWPRAVVSEDVWRLAGDHLTRGRLTLLGLWGDAAAVHMALLEEEPAGIAVVSLDCPSGTYPSIGHRYPPASRLERALRDLFGLKPVGLPDPRPWLDHGRWGLAHPLGARGETPTQSLSYVFLPAEGEGLHQNPGRSRTCRHHRAGTFPLHGEWRNHRAFGRAAGLRPQGHREPDGRGRSRACRAFAGRVSGDSTVAYSFAFARAVEAASNITIPPRAVFLRALMAELERLANHFGDIGAICNDAAFAIMHAHCAILRERVLRAADACFGHRLMMDRIVPGGVAANLDAAGASGLRVLIEEIRRRFPALIELYDNTASLQDRTVGTGRVATRSRAALWLRRLCGPRIGTRLRCAAHTWLCAL